MNQLAPLVGCSEAIEPVRLTTPNELTLPTHSSPHLHGSYDVHSHTVFLSRDPLSGLCVRALRPLPCRLSLARPSSLPHPHIRLRDAVHPTPDIPPLTIKVPAFTL